MEIQVEYGEREREPDGTPWRQFEPDGTAALIVCGTREQIDAIVSLVKAIEHERGWGAHD